MTGVSGEGDPAAEVAGLSDQTPIAELLACVEDLDADNERLRMRVLELLELMEEAVTAQVAGERRIAELERQSAALEAELDAMGNTRVMRMTAPARRAYAWLRKRKTPGAGRD